MRSALSVPFFMVVACCLWCCAIVAPACAPALAADVAGTVMVATPGAFVTRGGEQVPLKAKDTVQVGDTLATDATGRLRVWMRDETTISLGANSHFTLEAFDAAGSKPQLKGAMTGLARLLTGKIAKANPDGTVVNTPLASVGIRGTICTIEAGRDMTRVAVEACPVNVLVNGTALVSGQLGVVRQAGGAPQIAPLTPTIRQELGGQLAARRAPAPSLAQTAGPAGVGGLAPVTASPLYAAKDVAPDLDQALAREAEDRFRQTPLPLQLVGTVTANLTLGPNGVTRFDSGRYRYLAHNGFAKSGLEFDIDLTSGSGAISKAQLYGEVNAPPNSQEPILVSFKLEGGTGRVDKGAITIDKWAKTSPVVFNGDGSIYTNASGEVSGKLSIDSKKGITGINKGAYTAKGTSWLNNYVRVSGGINNVIFKGK